MTDTTRRPPAAAVPEGRGRLAPWQLAASSALTTALMSVVGATAPDLRTALGVSTAALTLAFIGQMLGALVGARATGRGRHRLLEITPAAAAACAGYAPTLALLIAAMAVAGFGAMVANAGAQAETMRRAGPRRAQALSRFHVWGGAGAAVFPLSVALALAAGAPYESAFLLIVAGYVFYAWINRRLRVVPSPREARRPPPRVSTRGRWAVVVAVLGGGLQLTFPLYLASLVVDHFHVSCSPPPRTATTTAQRPRVETRGGGLRASRGDGTTRSRRLIQA